MAMEAGLRISPEQWSSLLYGDHKHKSDMQSIIDKVSIRLAVCACACVCVCVCVCACVRVWAFKLDKWGDLKHV